MTLLFTAIDVSDFETKNRNGLVVIIIIIIIIITRPKPAYGQQGLVGSLGQDTDQASTFWGVLNVSLSSDLNQPGTINDGKNPPVIMKTRPGTIKTTKNYL